jgi:predicted phosphodiesterase
MPVALTGRNQDNVSRFDLMLGVVVRDDPVPMRYDQHLFRRVAMPSVPRSVLKGYRSDPERWRVSVSDQRLGEHTTDEKLTFIWPCLILRLMNQFHLDTSRGIMELRRQARSVVIGGFGTLTRNGTSANVRHGLDHQCSFDTRKARRARGFWMRIAVLADIHGFSLALERVLADIDRHGPYDRVLVAGDLCEGGPAPDAVLDRLRADSLPSVMGNTDRDIAAGTRRAAVAHWTRERIGAQGIEYLRDLPFELRVKPAVGRPDTMDLLIVHANPLDLDRHIQPDASEREVSELIGSVPAGAIAFGHLHIPYTRHINRRLLVDVSSVGNPKDGDLRSAWGSFVWDESESIWDAAIYRVPYPVDETVEQIRQSGMPRPEKLVESLLRASY